VAEHVKSRDKKHVMAVRLKRLFEGLPWPDAMAEFPHCIDTPQSLPMGWPQWKVSMLDTVIKSFGRLIPKSATKPAAITQPWLTPWSCCFFAFGHREFYINIIGGAKIVWVLSFKPKWGKTCLPLTQILNQTFSEFFTRLYMVWSWLLVDCACDWIKLCEWIGSSTVRKNVISAFILEPWPLLGKGF